ncbi:phospholipase D-like domain-containing protein [Nonomuraea typhae]|uniref:phospholipase D-like domain-containing protein n=1 Tax=Nonomuraea typhae TaxID=2603600 RepID=UPI0012F87E7A|nr:phospholipase D-like domain-containing protein [Nonomuraea typhae]
MTDRIDAGEVRLGGGFFLSRPGWRATPYTEEDDTASYSHLVTYRKSPRTLRTALLELIGSARRKVFVASFFLGDQELTEALRQAAARLRGGVYVISAIDESSLSRGLKGLEDEVGKDAAEGKRFDELCRAGIYVRGHENCHAKFAVADDESALVSTANFTTRALDVTGEAGVLIRDRPQAVRLGRLFARLWHTGCTWEIPSVPPDGIYTAARRSSQPWQAAVPQPGDGPGAGIIWTDENEQHLLRHLLSIIDGARSELLLATWNLNTATQDPALLIEPIRRAVARGVRTRLLVRTFNDRPAHRAEALALAEAGVEVCGDRETHVKGAFADVDAGALFSANFDAVHGLTSGVEIGCRLDGTPALAPARGFIRHMMDFADSEFVAEARQRDLHDRLLGRWHTGWPLGEEVNVLAREECWAALVKESEYGPLLYTGRPEEVRLFAGRTTWTISDNRLTRSAERRHSAGALLDQWLQRKGEGPRGFCPAVLTRVG